MKKLQNGFTLIELMIVVAIIGILAAVAIPAFNGRHNISDGTTCVGGYKFNIHTNQQIFSAQGGGIPCGGNVAGTTVAQ